LSTVRCQIYDYIYYDKDRPQIISEDFMVDKELEDMRKETQRIMQEAILDQASRYGVGIVKQVGEGVEFEGVLKALFRYILLSILSKM